MADVANGGVDVGEEVDLQGRFGLILTGETTGKQGSLESRQ